MEREHSYTHSSSSTLHRSFNIHRSSLSPSQKTTKERKKEKEKKIGEEEEEKNQRGGRRGRERRGRGGEMRREGERKRKGERGREREKRREKRKEEEGDRRETERGRDGEQVREGGESEGEKESGGGCKVQQPKGPEYQSMTLRPGQGLVNTRAPANANLLVLQPPLATMGGPSIQFLGLRFSLIGRFISLFALFHCPVYLWKWC